MKIRKMSGFSLMEMMVVLLIVAVVMAAAAPMVTRKMAAGSSGSDSLWTRIGVNGDIGYNLGDENITTFIGTTTGNNKSRLCIKSKDTPQIELTDKDNRSLNLSFINNSVGMTGNTNTGKESVAIGEKADVNDEYGAVAIGFGATTQHGVSVAVGHQAISNGKGNCAIGYNPHIEGDLSVAIGGDGVKTKNNSVAIGNNLHGDADHTILIGHDNKSIGEHSAVIGQQSTVEGDYSWVMGYNSYAKGKNAVAIGNEVTAGDNEFVLGNKENTVIIPGHLIVENGIEDISDRRLKNVGDVYKGGLAELKKLEIFNYTFKNDKNKTPRVGVMAQDLQKIFPAAVTKGDKGFLRIRQEDMFYAVINAVKELDARISALTEQVKSALDLTAKLEKKIAEQEKQINELKKQNTEFEKRLAKLEKNNK